MKHPPESEEAERGLIGSLLLDDDFTMGVCLEAGVVPEDFFNPSCRAVYQSCLDLKAEDRPVNILLIGDAMKKDGSLDKIGGRAFIESCADSCPTSAHAAHYAAIVAEKARLRAIISNSAAASELAYRGESTASSIASQAASSLLKVAREAHHQLSPDEHRENYIQAIRQAHNGIKVGVASRWMAFSNIIGNYRPKKLIIWGARPSCGKTTAMLNEAVTAGEIGEPVAIHSLEMPEEDLRLNMACAYAKVSTQRLICGHGTQEEIERVDKAFKYINSLPIHIYDKRTGIDGVESWMTMAYEKWGIKLYWLDYLTMIVDDGNNRNLDSWSRQIGDFCARIKERGKRHGICMNILAQLNRTGQKTETENTPSAPTLEALRDSGEIEQYADVVNLMCKMPDTTNSVFDGDNDWPMEWNIAKHRGGPIGRIPMVMIRKEQRYVTKIAHDDMMREKAQK